VDFFEYDGGDSLLVSWEGPGITKQPIPTSSLTSDAIDAGTGTVAGPGTPIDNTDGQVNFQYFEGQWAAIPNYDELVVVAQGAQSGFSLAQKQATDNYGFRFATNLEIPADGLYSFYLASDDGSRMTIDGDVLIDNDGLHGNLEINQSVYLEAGNHHVLVEFFERDGLDTLTVDWSAADMPRQALETANLSSASFTYVDTTNTGTGTGTGTMQMPTDSDIRFEYYEGIWTSLPDFNQMTPVATGDIAQFTLPPNNGELYYAYRYTGKIFIDEDDIYTFFTSSNDGSQLRIDGVLVVDNNGKHAVLEKQGSIDLSAGLHDIEVTYFQSNGSEALDVLWSSTTLPKQAIASSVLFAP